MLFTLYLPILGHIVCLRGNNNTNHSPFMGQNYYLPILGHIICLHHYCINPLLWVGIIHTIQRLSRQWNWCLSRLYNTLLRLLRPHNSHPYQLLLCAFMASIQSMPFRLLRYYAFLGYTIQSRSRPSQLFAFMASIQSMPFRLYDATPLRHYLLFAFMAIQSMPFMALRYASSALQSQASHGITYSPPSSAIHWMPFRLYDTTPFSAIQFKAVHGLLNYSPSWPYNQCLSWLYYTNPLRS